MNETFKNAKVGSRVWSFTHGWGIVIKKFNFGINHFKLVVKFDLTDLKEEYRDDGRADIAENQTLFWDEVKFQTPERSVKQIKVSGWVVGILHPSTTYCKNNKWFWTDSNFEFKFLSPTEPENIYTNQVSFPVRGFLAQDEDV
jgi:hypothetical protein